MTFLQLLTYSAAAVGMACLMSLLLFGACVAWDMRHGIPSEAAARRIALVQAETSEELAVRTARRILSTPTS